MKSTLLLSFLPALVAAGPGINPNPNPNFDPTTSPGTFGPFIPALQPANTATGGPATVDPRSAQALQLAMSNWQTDTGIVSGFLNVGGNTNDPNAFKGIADGAFKAEVDELTQKALLDSVIGNDPRVSIANLTLTNGVFQSVVDNLQIMSLQGQARVNLINTINSVRCTQILPSIDTYLVVAAEYIGSNAQQRRAVRPAGCAQVLAAANSTAFPNVPGTPNGTPTGTGDGNINGVPGACQNGAGNLGTITNTNTGTGTNTGNGGKNGGGKGTNTGNNNATGSAANSPLPNITTPQLGGIVGSPSASSGGGASASNTAANNAATSTVASTSASTTATAKGGKPNQQKGAGKAGLGGLAGKFPGGFGGKKGAQHRRVVRRQI